MDNEEQINQLADQIERRTDKLLERLRRIERELDDKIGDVECAIDRVERKVREMENKARY